MPRFLAPQLATPEDEGAFGISMDSRNQIRRLPHPARIDGDDRRAYTRNGYNWVSRFSRIAGAFEIEGQAIVDGEVVVIHEGRTNFSKLQADLGRGDRIDRSSSPSICCGWTAEICARSRRSSGRGCSRI